MVADETEDLRSMFCGAELSVPLENVKGVVHPQNDFLSIDYSCLGHLSSIVFFCICRIRKTSKKRIRVNLPLFILIGDPRPRGSPIKMNGGKFTKTIFLS